MAVKDQKVTSGLASICWRSGSIPADPCPISQAQHPFSEDHTRPSRRSLDLGFWKQFVSLLALSCHVYLEAGTISSLSASLIGFKVHPDSGLQEIQDFFSNSHGIWVVSTWKWSAWCSRIVQLQKEEQKWSVAKKLMRLSCCGLRFACLTSAVGGYWGTGMNQSIPSLHA